MNVTSAELWMNFNQVLQAEDTMKIVFISLICKCMQVFALYCLLKIGASNCPIKEILYLLTYYNKNKAHSIALKGYPKGDVS